MIVLLIFAGLVGVLFGGLLLEQLLFEKQEPSAPVRLPGHLTPPPLPSPTPWHTDPGPDRVRPAVDGTGRHRRLGGPQ